MKRFLCGASIAAVVVACSSSSPDHDYSSALAKAICDQLAPCCMANGFTYDKGQCEIGGAAFAQSGNDANKMAGAMFDQKAADDCVAAIRTLAGQCKSGADDPVLSEPCRRVWVGTKAPGAACSNDIECAPAAGTRGACVDKACAQLSTHGKLGDSCATTDCNASGFQCDALGSKTCIAQTAMGGKCGPLTTCAKGTYCDSTGVCAAALAKGAMCTANSQCASNGCINGSCGANDLGTSKPCNGS
jgi:hypothetical protein